MEKSLGKMDFSAIIYNNASIVAMNLNKNPIDIKNAIIGWIDKETGNEIEAYSVTLSILKHSKHNPIVSADRTLSKEFYSYLNKAIKTVR